MVYQQDPDSIIWMCTTEGKLMGLTYDQSEQVKAWHEHDVGGKVIRLEPYDV
jgi:hypothetical protein